MRRAQKKQAENYIKFLLQSDKELKSAVVRQKNTDAVRLLGESQNAAVELGNLIEQAERDSREIVALLENYCELLWRVYERFRKNQTTNVSGLYEELACCLKQIESCVKNKIKIRLEVVFLPYKASMWDSMESVWRAADEDPDSDVYVIPIPYYDRDACGNIGEMHDESKLYPAEVPITNYRTYDLNEHRPDMIFIHNPYDKYNYATCVHPWFFSNHLKQFTDQLVYMPYFIHQNEVVSENYCILPGVLYADKVILQSQKVKEQYMEYFKAATGRMIEGKFQAWGSPKLDLEKDTERIPKQWKRLIYKEGRRRKVIFLNTHFACLSPAAEKDFFCKMKEIFSYFSLNADVVLLWRPHPLSRAATNAMNPQVLPRYTELVEEYKKAGFGIYDDSPDFQRAVRIADAYYGTKSSVTELFLSMGKPVMLMNLRLHKEASCSSMN